MERDMQQTKRRGREISKSKNKETNFKHYWIEFENSAMRVTRGFLLTQY